MLRDPFATKTVVAAHAAAVTSPARTAVIAGVSLAVAVSNEHSVEC
jgi:hypothetical protein